MIEVENLTKTFGPIIAVDNVSFAVAAGDVLGFLGPNGAGKSTTMKLLAGFLAPDSGTARIIGIDIVKEPVRVKKQVGYVAENAPAYEEMSVRAFLKFVCGTRGISGDARTQAIDKIASTCAIESVMYQSIGTLSKGFRRRVGLAQALIHDPPVLILDEPTDGLDPNQKHDVRLLIKDLAAKSEKAIIVSTHILEEVDAICNRIIIINRGRILVDSTPTELRRLKGGTLEEIFRRITRPEAGEAPEPVPSVPAETGKGGAS